MLTQYQTLRRPPAVAGKTAGENGLFYSSSTQKLQELKSQLADLRTKYTAQHPDVVRLESEIAETEKQVAADEQVAKKQGVSAVGQTANPEDLQTAAAMLQTQSQLKAVEFEIASRRNEIKNIEAEIDTYQKKLNLAPAREQELAAITRDHEQSRAYYESLLAKKNQSEMATNLEKRQQGEQFRMIDPPSFPQRPYFPNRLLFSLGGVVFGIVLGVGSIVARELINGRVYGEDELATVVKSSNVVLIPSVLTASETRARSRSKLIDGAIAAVIALAIPAATLFLYYKA
jgi:polysaccharide biosynthesis transport protein